MRKQQRSLISVIVCAHNEEGVIGNCLNSLLSMKIPEAMVVEYFVVLDRCCDRTKQVVEKMGVPTIEKNFRGCYASPITEAVAYGIKNTKGDLVLICDADIQEIPQDALLRLLPHLNGKVKRVSSEVKTRSGKWWLDFLFWLKDLNSKITPLGIKPRGAFTVFERHTVEQIAGFDPNKPTWDTAFDLKLEARGWTVKRVRDVVVTERRDFAISRLIRRQIADGKARRKLRLSFLRTLLHSVFRGRFFVVYGYMQEVWKEKIE